MQIGIYGLIGGHVGLTISRCCVILVGSLGWWAPPTSRPPSRTDAAHLHIWSERVNWCDPIFSVAGINHDSRTVRRQFDPIAVVSHPAGRERMSGGVGVIQALICIQTTLCWFQLDPIGLNRMMQLGLDSIRCDWIKFKSNLPSWVWVSWIELDSSWLRWFIYDLTLHSSSFSSSSSSSFSFPSSSSALLE